MVDKNNQLNHFNMKLFKNNNSGHTGVYWFKRDKKWQAQITLDNKRIHLGYFNNIQDAILARKESEKLYHAI